MTALLVLAFGAGLLAPINPCGFAVLPAFLAYGTRNAAATGTRGTWARLAWGLRSGLALAIGFAGTFTIVGLLLAAGMRSLIGAFPWVAAVLGAVFALLGLVMLVGIRIPVGIPRLAAIGQDRKTRGGMVVFGAGYALASASCSLALLVAVVTQALAGEGLVTVLLVFGAYAAGSTILLLSLSVVTAFASTVITTRLRRLMPHMNRITGAILTLSGVYLLVYWLPQLFGGDPGTNLLAGVAGPISSWVGDNLILVSTIAGAAVVVTVIGAVLHQARKGRQLPETDDCCEPSLTQQLAGPKP
ncbi:cytochrome c biogenesis protein CcdA [uncultured Microbacterium sp.]|uniref:cytochrome c biogenesis CcdA family protein n=1 Tax=uncultured Microbacterium sp. TaxID=191216 RepID=UPI00261B33D0|nr:cytochrome c biogenesis protein CcdA [uncultured Microbacterium sp.]